MHSYYRLLNDSSFAKPLRRRVSVNIRLLSLLQSWDPLPIQLLFIISIKNGEMSLGVLFQVSRLPFQYFIKLLCTIMLHKHVHTYLFIYRSTRRLTDINSYIRTMLSFDVNTLNSALISVSCSFFLEAVQFRILLTNYILYRLSRKVLLLFG